MSRFLIEVPHEEEVLACARAVEIFLRTGSHFLSHADWGCMDGDHRAVIIVEANDRDEARNVIPPEFRPGAKIVQLNSFTLETIEEIRRRHGAQP
jgi:hypothetical protein